MLLSAVNIAVSVCEDSVYDPGNLILPEGYGVVVDDLKKAYDVVVARQKNARDTSERWFGVASVESSVVRESSGQQGVFESPILLKWERSRFCLSPCPPHESPARALVSKVLKRGNRSKVRR